jgi:phospholipid/cholesterol/gamma-HCH transport system substrate-binding protein
MRPRNPLISLVLISGYLAIAATVIVFLALKASRGGLFGSASQEYTGVIPKAPGIVANKTDVLNPAGVPIGVVTSVKPAGGDVEVRLKLTRPIPVHEDAFAVATTKTILGEKSIMLDPGSPNKPLLASTGRLKPNKSPGVSEPHEALDPIAGLAKGVPPIQPMVENLEAELAPVLTQLDAMLADAETLSVALGSQDETLARIGTRLADLVRDLSTRDADIAHLVGQLAALTTDLGTLVDENLGQVDDILLMVSRLTSAVAGRQAELDQALAALPSILTRLQVMLETTLRVFEGTPGRVFYSNVTNLPSLQTLLEILKAGR